MYEYCVTKMLNFVSAGHGPAQGNCRGTRLTASCLKQIKAGFDHPVGVTFTILADGSVADVHVTQPSGASLLDMAAQRAILNAAPFGPLPREYGTNRKTIQAIFRPTE